MQVFIKLKLGNPLALPLSYHHIVQGIIYHLASRNPILSSWLHNRGNQYGNRPFKLFCFSSLHGKNTIEGGRITFWEEVHFEIRSVNNQLIQIIAETAREEGLRFGNRVILPEYVKVTERVIPFDEVLVEMSSPLTVYKTDPETKERYFLTPLDRDFSERVADNFRRKYEAFAGNSPDGGIEIETMAVAARDRYTTVFKKNRIVGWRGIYRIHGLPEYLTFLYDAGLGSNNSQGFGMIEVIGV